MKLSCVLITAVAVLAVACSESETAKDTPDAGGPAAEVLAFGEQVAEAWAKKEAECEKADLELATAYWTAYYENQANKAGPGGLLFDSVAAGKCIDAVKSLPCHELLDCTLRNSLPPECVEVFYGTAKVGEACNPGCERGAACRISMSSEPWCSRCVTRLREGDACVEGAHDAVCSEGLTCLEGKCSRRRMVSQNDPCDPFTTVCEGGSYCADSGKCEARKTSGSCSWWDECAPGYGCVNGSCQKWKARGEACESPDECELHAACSENDGCELPDVFLFLKTGVGLGQSCAEDPCMSGLRCNEQSTTCELRPLCAE
ncbi:MAG: hypothetical protein ACOX6T_01000 [Myxococcales bacterium]|jgi:hypothetical protein